MAVNGNPIEFSHGLRFPCPKSFDGSEKGFDDFAYRLRAYLTLAHPNSKRYMKRVQEAEVEVDWDSLEEDQKQMAAQL